MTHQDLKKNTNIDKYKTMVHK